MKKDYRKLTKKEHLKLMQSALRAANKEQQKLVEEYDKKFPKKS